MKKTLTLLLVALSTVLFSQEKGGFKPQYLSGGFNRIPLLYYRPIFGPGLGGIPFAFHASASFPMTEKLSVRGGANFSLGRLRIPHLRGGDCSLGVEGGFEYAFLKEDSKWFLNGAVLVFASHWSDQLSFDRDDLVWNTVGIGPEVLLGYKLNEQWAIFSAFNFEAGYFDWGTRFSEPEFGVTSYRMLSVEARYTLK